MLGLICFSHSSSFTTEISLTLENTIKNIYIVFIYIYIYLTEYMCGYIYIYITEKKYKIPAVAVARYICFNARIKIQITSSFANHSLISHC